MQDFSFIYLIIGVFTSAIGAVPLGLVNLSVVDAAIKFNIRKSMQIAYGAAIIEILFVLLAFVAGSYIENFLTKSIWVKVFIILVLLLAGIIVLFTRNSQKPKEINSNLNGVLKGVILNLISVQVLLFWLIAMTFLSVRDMLPDSNLQLVLFLIGVFITKIGVLRLYALLATKVVEKSQPIAKNINRVIGIIFILVAFVQVFRFW